MIIQDRVPPELHPWTRVKARASRELRRPLETAQLAVHGLEVSVRASLPPSYEHELAWLVHEAFGEGYTLKLMGKAG